MVPCSTATLLGWLAGRCAGELAEFLQGVVDFATPLCQLGILHQLLHAFVDFGHYFGLGRVDRNGDKPFETEVRHDGLGEGFRCPGIGFAGDEA